MPENLDHVVGTDVERVGVEGGVEEALGFGLAADLHVEHAQADRGVGAGRVGGGGQQEGSLGRVILAAVGQSLGQGGVKGRGPGVVGQCGEFGGGGPHGIDQQPARGRQPRQRVFVARVFGHGLHRGGLGIVKSLVGDVEVGQEHIGRCVVRVDGQGMLGLGPARGQAIALQVGLARASPAPREKAD